MDGETRYCQHATYGGRRSGRGRPRAAVRELAEVRTAAQLVAALRWRRRLSGLTFAELRRRAAAVGDDLSREAMVLDGAGLPRVRTVAALVRACGGEATEIAAWVATCRRIAPPTPPRPASTGRLPSWLADTPPTFRQPRRSVRRLVLGITSLVVFAVVGVLVIGVPFGEHGADRVAVAPDDRKAEDGGTGDDAAGALAPTPPGEPVQGSVPPRKRDGRDKPAPHTPVPPVDEAPIDGPLNEVPPHDPAPRGPVFGDPGCSYHPVPSCDDDDRGAP